MKNLFVVLFFLQIEEKVVVLQKQNIWKTITIMKTIKKKDCLGGK